MNPSDIVFNNNISNRDKFGIFLRYRRKELDMTVGELSSQLNVSSAYVSDIENGNRYAPLNYLEDLVEILQIENEEIEYFYDLAGCTHLNWPEINEYLAKTPNARKAIRLARDRNLTGEEFFSLITSYTKEEDTDEFVR